MSQTHDIDNDAPFFLELDPYEPLNGSHHLEGYVREPQHPISRSHDSPQTSMSPSLTPPLEPSVHQLSMSHDVENVIPTHNELDGDLNVSSSSPSKGKGVSKPLDIHRKELDMQIDVLPVGGSSSSSDNYNPAHAWAVPSSSVDAPDFPFVPYDDVVEPVDSLGENVGDPSGFSAKGKGRERPPVLPPLVFMPTAFEYGSPEWPLDMSPQTAGPSSYGSGFASLSEVESEHSNDITPPITPEASMPLDHVPARRRSLSNLSVRSTRSLSALSISKVKVKFPGSKTPGNIARKLLFRKGRDPSTDTNPTPATTPTGVIDPEFPGNVELGRGSCFLPWAPPLKSCTSPPVGTLVDIDVDLSCGPLQPTLYRPTEAAILRSKGRSYSSPFPLPTSPFDIVPLTPAEISEPVRVDVRNYFDEDLPRELKLHILASIVGLYEAEHARAVSSGKWTAITAGRSRNRWVGIEKGVRELLKLSRVGIFISCQRTYDDLAVVSGFQGLAEPCVRRTALDTAPEAPSQRSHPTLRICRRIRSGDRLHGAQRAVR